MIDKFLIINQILLLLFCSSKYILQNLIYEILIHYIIEFPMLVDLVAWEHREYPFIMTSFIIRNLDLRKGMQETWNGDMKKLMFGVLLYKILPAMSQPW